MGIKQSVTDCKAVISEERGISEERPLSQQMHEKAEVALSSLLLHVPLDTLLASGSTLRIRWVSVFF